MANRKNWFFLKSRELANLKPLENQPKPHLKPQDGDCYG
jgi:hypothetical protein